MDITKEAADGGYWTAGGWLAAHAEYEGLDAAEVSRRARQLSAGASLFIAKARHGGHVMTGFAIRMAADAEDDLRRRMGDNHYRARTANRAISDWARATTYEAVLVVFSTHGGSFEAWCRLMGFDSRRARHAVQHPDSRHAEYKRIRAALKEALENLLGGGK